MVARLAGAPAWDYNDQANVRYLPAAGNVSPAVAAHGCSYGRLHDVVSAHTESFSDIEARDNTEPASPEGEAASSMAEPIPSDGEPPDRLHQFHSSRVRDVRMALKDKLVLLPDGPGIYQMKDASAKIIYIGKAKNLKNRVRSYFQTGRDVIRRTLLMVGEIADVDWIVTSSELEALLLECTLIKQHRPHYNVRLKDDKNYPYIRITTSEPFPRITTTRKARRDGDLYFGPFTSSHAMRETMRVMRPLFKLRLCGNPMPDKKCIYFDIKQCSGPCIQAVTPEDYRDDAQSAARFLDGHSERVVKDLTSQMMAAAESENFERAIKLRDRIQGIQRTMERQKVISDTLTDQDVIALVKDNGRACAEIFYIRGGRLVGNAEFPLETGGEDLEEVIRSFVMQYYVDSPHIPREILLQKEVEEMKIIEDWLRQRGGRRVELKAPARGEKKRMVEMAAANAQQALDQMRAQMEAERANLEGPLIELRDALGLEAPPLRMECYDISNIQGSDIVASMVVFEEGKPKKSDYRQFKIRSVAGAPNDFQSMREVIERRFRNASEGHARFSRLPDLVVIDGGIGQVNGALDAMAKFGITPTNAAGAPEEPVEAPAPFTDARIAVIGLEKREELIVLPGRKERVALPTNSSALFVLQNLRDEAHRFAKKYHVKLRTDRAVVSQLDSVPGIGKKRRTELIKHFGSFERIRDANEQDLAAAPGMNRAVAREVYRRLHPDPVPAA
ncbi:MAG TPA: excinuclease ABC subunit UvrC [Armatimonadota bacterium]|nr:excinuclease ABC subunit UvrC [Armatimonadota bacterium]